MASMTKDGGRYATEGADFQQANRFEVRIEGIAIGAFQEVTLPEIEMEQIEYHVGTSRGALKRPGQYKVGDLVLKRGYAHNRMLEEWFYRIKKGDAERRSMSIDMINEHDEVTATFDFFNAWPKKWKVANLDASKAEQVVEEVTFALEDFARSA